MKPIKLEIEGLHSFEAKQTIDFSALSSQGIFGIFGATGSGKSTILDAIILALYGKVQRSKTNSDFINLKSKKAVINFEFSFIEEGKEKIYKINRTFKRKPKNNQEVEQVAEVFELGAFGSRQIVEGVSKVDDFVKNLIGMSDAEFLKCIALPQGEFASFLKAKPNERVSIIGNIFDLNKYGQELWEKVKVKTDLIERDKAIVEGKLSVVGEVDMDKFKESKNTHSKLIEDINEKRTKLTSLKKTEKEEREIARLGAELDEVQKNLKKYDEMKSSVSMKKKALEKAKKLGANKFIFSRYEELAAVILKDDGEIKKKRTALENAKINSQEYFCNTLLELDGLQSNSRKSIEKLERLKALKEVEAKSEQLAEKIKLLTADSQILENKGKSIEKKLIEKRALKGISSKELETIDSALVDLKEQLRGYGSVLTYNSLVGFVGELKKYNEFTQNKYEEAVRGLTASIKIQENLLQEKDKTVDEIKSLYKRFGVRGGLTEGRLIPSLNRAQEEYRRFVSTRSAVEVMLENRAIFSREHRNLQEQLDRYEIDKVHLDIKVQEIEKDIAHVKSDILRLKAVRDKALVDTGLYNVMDRLRIGDECPICRSEILQKSSFNSIDIMVVENNLADANEVLARKIEARDTCLFSIAKLVSKMDDTNEKMVTLETKIRELTKLMLSKLDLPLEEENFDIADELKNREKVFVSDLESHIKAVAEEKQLYAKLHELEVDITKQNCVNATTRMEMSVLSELMESFSASIKEKDLELLGYVSSNEDVTEKLKKMEELNAELDQKLTEREEKAKYVLEVEGEINKLEIELSATLTEKEGLKTQIAEFKKEHKENSILLKSETIGGRVDYTVKLEQEELETYKHRETEIVNMREELKNVVHQLEVELNNMEAVNLAHKDEYKNLKKNINSVLDELKLDDLSEAKLFMMEDSEISLLENVVVNHEDNLKLAETKKRELESLLSGRISSPAILDQICVQIGNLEEEIKEKNDQSIKLTYDINIMEEKIAVYESLTREFEKLNKEYGVHKELYDLLKGKALLEFIAEEFIDDISFMASQKMQVLMDGRYLLRYDNKEFYVVDNFNDANVRPVATLSGGELFVVSLALALSISDAIASKSNKSIDFFFLDEGFGTLDKEYCEYIVDSLVKLESQNLTIGLISHIPELQERVSQKLEVVKTASGSVVKLKLDI